MKTIHLTGDFTLDAVSPKGTMLYLLEYYAAGTRHYNVRAYDVNANQLLEGSIVDKNELGEKMQGEALTRQMSEDGDMAYTLYINPVTNKAFIHTLWLADQLWLIPNAKIAHFNPGTRTVSAADQARKLHDGAVLSRDQKLLYVAGLYGIWVIKTNTLKVQAQYLKEQSFTGLAESSDGQTLYGVDPTNGITLLDPSSGATCTVIKGIVQSPWSIEWAT